MKCWITLWLSLGAIWHQTHKVNDNSKILCEAPEHALDQLHRFLIKLFVLVQYRSTDVQVILTVDFHYFFSCGFVLAELSEMVLQYVHTRGLLNFPSNLTAAGTMGIGIVNKSLSLTFLATHFFSGRPDPF